jgi:hypothetical protein
MLPNLAVVDGELFAKPQVFRVHHGLVVEGAEDDLPFLVAVIYANPHPFSGETLNPVLELDLDVVTAIKSGHMTPLWAYSKRIWNGYKWVQMKIRFFNPIATRSKCTQPYPFCVQSGNNGLGDPQRAAWCAREPGARRVYPLQTLPSCTSRSRVQFSGTLFVPTLRD